MANNPTKRNVNADRGDTQKQQNQKPRKSGRKKSAVQKLKLLLGKKWPEIVRVGVTLVDIAMRIRDHKS